MQTHKLKKLLEEHPDGIDVAVVTGHTVQMKYRSNVVDTLQSANRVRLTAVVPEGEPMPEGIRWSERDEYKRRTVFGVLMEDAYEFDPISGKKGETVYFEPRRVLNTWAEREAEQAQDAAMRERWAREKAETVRDQRAIAKRLAAAQKALGLVLNGKPLIVLDVYDDGSYDFDRPSKYKSAEIADLLDNLVEANG